MFMRKLFKLKVVEDTVDFGYSDKYHVLDEYCCNIKKNYRTTTQYKCVNFNSWNCRPALSGTAYHDYVERLDENHDFTFYLELNYVDSSDYFIVHYPSYNYNYY